MIKQIIGLLVMLLSSSVFSTTIYIPVDQPTIQAGIAISSEDDTVLVSAGNYTENLIFPLHRVSVIAECGADSTSLQGTIDVIDSDSGSVFTGFKITLFSSVTEDIVSIINTDFFEFSQNKILASIFDFAIRADSLSSDLKIIRNSFANPFAKGITVLTLGPRCKFINNTVYGYSDHTNRTRGVYVYGQNSLILNNIIAGFPSYGIYDPHSTSIVNFNNLWNNNPDYGGSATPGYNDLSLDPRCLDPFTYQFELEIQSPCLNAGHVLPIYNDPDGTRNDIGAEPSNYPWIVSVFPKQSGISIPVNSEVSIEFNVDMNSTSINSSTFLVYSKLHGGLDGVYSYNEPLRTALFQPSIPFSVGDEICVSLTSQIESVEGITLAAPFTWRFVVAAPAGYAHFEPSIQSFAVGDAPVSVVFSEIHGDGFPDIITANYNPTSWDISILEGNGSGWIQSYNEIDVGRHPNSVLSIDVDRDGDQDVFVANLGADSIVLLTNDGTGLLAITEIVTPGDAPWKLVSGDVNGDGLLDILSLNAYSDSVAILLNDQFGGVLFDDYIGLDSVSYGIACGDVDLDGDQDIVVAETYLHKLVVFRNNGLSSFTKSQEIGVGQFPFDVIIMEINGDGVPDLVSANNGSDDVSIVIGNLISGFSDPYTVTVGERPWQITGGDFDGDSDLDLASVNWESDDVSILINDGAGIFSSGPTLSVGSHPRGIDIVDFDLDGDLDIVVCNSSSDDITILTNVMGFLPPELITFGDSTLIYDMLTEFMWHPAVVYNEGDSIEYILQISNDSLFNISSHEVTTVDTTFRLVDSLNFQGNYYWRVMARNQFGVTINSNYDSFWTWTLGDLNHSHTQDISDLTYMVDYMFRGGEAIDPLFIGDVDGSCTVNISDLTYLVDYMFRGGPSPKVGCE